MIVRPKFQPSTILTIALIIAGVIIVILVLKLKGQSTKELLVLAGIAGGAYALKSLLDAYLRRVDVGFMIRECRRYWNKQHGTWAGIEGVMVEESPPASAQWVVYFPSLMRCFFYDHNRKSVTGNVIGTIDQVRYRQEQSLLTRLALQRQDIIDQQLREALSQEGFRTP